MTTREAALAALFERLRTIPHALVKREEPLPDKVPAGGLAILRDGDPGEPEVLLSPLSYLWRHRAEIEVVVQGPPEAATAALDALLLEIDAALAADRSLSGRVDWLDWGGPQTRDLALDGAAGIKAAVVPVILHFETFSPLS
ncbi:MAG: acyl-CoA transferase [Magnetospirillum sp. WYHS-4]